MSRVRGANTKPELAVRSALHGLGYRFRLHRRDLPGTPDIVLPKHSLAIFVHGCFWHGHQGCSRATVPATRTEFWVAKIRRNIDRDEGAKAELEKKGYRVLTFWECELKKPEQVSALVKARLEGRADAEKIATV